MKQQEGFKSDRVRCLGWLLGSVAGDRDVDRILGRAQTCWMQQGEAVIPGVQGTAAVRHKSRLAEGEQRECPGIYHPCSHRASFFFSDIPWAVCFSSLAHIPSMCIQAQQFHCKSFSHLLCLLSWLPRSLPPSYWHCHPCQHPPVLTQVPFLSAVPPSSGRDILSWLQGQLWEDGALRWRQGAASEPVTETGPLPQL